ncbi:hypothetical protein ABPG72_021933 [Tetrahymena utriculariae]
MEIQNKDLKKKDLKIYQGKIDLQQEVFFEFYNYTKQKTDYILEILKELIEKNKDNTFLCELYLVEKIQLKIQKKCIKFDQNQKNHNQLNIILSISLQKKELSRIFQIIDIFKVEIKYLNVQIQKQSFGYKDLYQLSKLIQMFQNARNLKVTFMKFSQVRNQGYMALGSKISKLKELTKIKIAYLKPSQIYQDQLNNLITFLKKLPKLENFCLHLNGSPDWQNKAFIKNLKDISLKKFKFEVNCLKNKLQENIDEIICQIAEARNIKNITINAFNRELGQFLVQKILDITNNSSNLDSFTFMLNFTNKNSDELYGLEQILQLSQVSKVFFSIQVGELNNLYTLKSLLTKYSCLTGLELLQSDAYGLSNILDESHFKLIAVLQKQEKIQNFKITTRKCSLQNYILLYQQLANMRSLKKACVLAQCESGMYKFQINKLNEGDFSISDAIKEDRQVSSIFNNSLSLEVFHKQEEYIFLTSLLQLCQPNHIKLLINPTYSKNYQDYLIEKYISPLINYDNKIMNLELLFEGIQNKQNDEDEKIKKDFQDEENQNSQQIQLDFSILKTLFQKQNSIQNLKVNIDSNFLLNNQIVELFDVIQFCHLQIPTTSINFQFEGELNQFKMQQIYGNYQKTKKQPDSLWIKQKDSLYYTVISVSEEAEVIKENVNNLFQAILKKIFDNKNSQITSIKYLRKFYYDSDDMSFWNQFKNNLENLQTLPKLEIVYFPQDKFENSWNSNKNCFRFNYLKNLMHLKSLRINCPCICFEQQGESDCNSQYQFLNEIKKLDISFAGTSNYEYHRKLINNIIQNLSDVEQLKINNLRVNLSEKDLKQFLENLKKLVKLQVLDISFALDDQISLLTIIEVQKKLEEISKNVRLEFQSKSRRKIMRIPALLLISLVSLLGVATFLTLSPSTRLQQKANLDQCLYLQLGLDIDQTTQKQFFSINQCLNQSVSFQFQINVDGVAFEQTTSCIYPGGAAGIPNITSLFQIVSFTSSSC